MSRSPKPLRLFEIALWVFGISLLGAATGDTLDRWNYQSQQERALFNGGPAASVASGDAESVGAEPPVLPAIEFGPPAPMPPPRVERAAVTPPRVTKKKTPAPDPDAFGRIEIPRLGMAAIVKEGGDEKTLARAVGLVPGSPRPGDSGNVVLAGHRDTFFWPLRKVKLNDRIRLVVPPHTYEYEVQSVRVVEPEETDVLESRGLEELTLVTCYPFRFVGPAPERFIVSALRVN